MSVSSMKQSIARSIKRYGTSVTLKTISKGGIDFSTGTASEIATDNNILALIGTYKSSEIVEGVINIDDIKCTLQFDGDITDSDYVLISGVKYHIVRVNKLMRSGELMKYTLQLRG